MRPVWSCSGCAAVAAAQKSGRCRAFVAPSIRAPYAPVVWLGTDQIVELVAAADRGGTPADADFRVDRFPANTHLCIDAVGGQHFIFKTDTKRIGLHVDGALATLGPVRLTFSTVSMSRVSKAIDEFALLTEILFPDPGKAAQKAKSRPVTRIELRDALIGLDGKCAGAILCGSSVLERCCTAACT
jgi:hypothetical protein